jgi:hypothetical protein
MEGLLILSIFIIGLLIYFAINNCKIELRYRNILLEEQNRILKENKNGI